MKRLRSIAIAFVCGICATGVALAQDSDPLVAEVASIDAQIAEVEKTIGQYEGGLIRVLAEMRREALLLLRNILEVRREAEGGGAKIEIVVPAVEPDPARAEELLGEIAQAQANVEEAEREAEKAGGLIQAIALSRVETEKLTLAQLQMAYLQARYGIAFPSFSEGERTTSAGSGISDTTSDAEVNVSGDVAENLPWADPDYPDIDYNLAPFEQAYRDGHSVSGWWTIRQERAAIDDSPEIIAANLSQYESRSFGGLTALVAQCREGRTSIVFIQDDFLINDFDRDSFDIVYRIDDQPAQSARWSELTSNKGAGLFGSRSESFLRDLYDAKRFFIRLRERNGETHDAVFDLSGIQKALEIVSGGCGWSTLKLTRDDYRAIQTALNAGGYATGTPDGIWGAGSRAAMREFQKTIGLTPTGAPDRQTLEALGLQAGK